MKSRIIVVTEYSHGRTFEDAVENLSKKGLMIGSYTTAEVESREQARRDYHSWYSEVHHEAEVAYIVTEKYDEEYGKWLVDYSAGVEVLPCH